MLDSSLRLEQKLYLAPQMQYALTLLQMDAEELLQHVLDQAMQNPLIALDPLSLLSSKSSINESVYLEIPDEKNKDDLLQVALYRQLPLDLPADVDFVVRQLIDMLDSAGYLRYSREELADSLGISMDLLNSALDILHSLEPAGIGAADLPECLLLQLKRLPETDDLACKIAESYLEDAAAGKLRKIAKLENASLSRVEAAFQLVRTLSPYPASGFSCKDSASFVIPDLSVSSENGILSITLTEQSMPPLRRSDFYKTFVQTDDESTQDFISVKENDFTRLKHAITMRSRTLLSIAQIIVTRQKQFFLTGDRSLSPLSLEDISNEVGLHISTVSRAIQNKYLICPRGVFPLKFFLSRYTRNSAQGAKATSQDQVRCAIRKLIDEEAPQAPLSDSQLFQALREQGFPLSRRTVVNYREKMGIPSSYVRRQQANHS